MSTQWERWPRTEDAVELECACACGQTAECKGTAGATLAGDAIEGSVATTIAAPEQAKQHDRRIQETRMDYREAEDGGWPLPEEDEQRQQDADVLAAHDLISGYLQRAAKVCPPTILEAASIAWLHGVRT